ncbi:integrase [Streptomyces sp. NPDC053474]|uniref:integrase n=1 Tax=Streptomyces sp. NPDC053474 TaxID=3365704 RepID=UPI0037D3C051
MTNLHEPGAIPVPGPRAGALVQPEEFDAETRAVLDRVGLAAEQVVRDKRPENTRKSYGTDWTAWERFTREKNLPVLAVEPGTLTAFVHWLWEQPGKKAGTLMAPNTIDRRISGVVVTARKDHHLKLDPDVGALARELLKALVKEMEQAGQQRGTGPAPALRIRHMKRISRALPGTLAALRDRSLMTLHFAIAGREHEVAYLRLRDITEDPEGRGLIVDIRVSKVKPRTVKVLYLQDPAICPVRCWWKWVEAAGLEDPDDFAFRRIHSKGTTLLPGGLSPEAVGDVITRLGETAGLEIRPTGHSPRRALASEGKKAGNDRSAIARQGGWAPNSRAMEGYFEEEDGWEENALSGVG